MTIHAKVTLTIEIDSGSSWGNATTFDQVSKQATEGALGRVGEMCGKYGARIVGKPEVMAIMYDLGKRG